MERVNGELEKRQDFVRKDMYEACRMIYSEDKAITGRKKKDEVIKMYRLFQTHQIRKQIELPAVWQLQTLDKSMAVKKKIPIPCCIETIPELGKYKGEVKIWTEKEFGGNLKLTFKGVGHTAEVGLDETYLGSHYGAYGEFSFILKDIPYDKHVISVTADNSYSQESALHVENDYYSYGGITRPVLLEQIGDVYVKWIHVKPVRQEGCWWAETEICLENISDTVRKVSMQTEVTNSDGMLGECVATEAEEVLIPAGETVVFSGKIECLGIEEYECDNPVMYYLHVTLCENGEPVDDLIERFGFREIKVEGKDILWNGKPVQIKGFNRHEDYGEFGSAVPLSAMQRDLELIRDTGANCVRTCHYPNDERFLDLCDEQGILVWEEAHARALDEEQMRNPRFMEQSALTINEMITEHYNHPSIYVWGLLNECASHTDYGRSCYAKLIEQIRSLDNSRPVTFASCQFDDDICLDLVDIVSYNYYPKWYHDTPVSEYLSSRYQWIQTTGGAGKPLLVSEIGAGAIYGYRSPLHDKWSEEYQADALEEQITAVLSFPDCSGIILWQYADCRVDESWFQKRPKSQNNKGVVDMYRRPKLAYEKVKELFHQL